VAENIKKKLPVLQWLEPGVSFSTHANTLFVKIAVLKKNIGIVSEE
jgi:hypothetical protein